VDTTTSLAPTLTTATTLVPSAGVRVVDDTDFLTVTVPVDWDEHETVSSRRDDGSDRPQITAAPSLEQFFETVTGPGLYVVALPPTTDPAVVLAQNDWTGICSDGGVMPYDDGRFVGQLQSWLNCDGGTSRIVQLAVRPLANTFTMSLQVAQSTPDDAQLLRIVGSAAVVSGAFYPTLVAPVPLVPTGVVPPELLLAPSVSMRTVADQTGRLTMSVPSTWTDTDGTPDFNDNGSDRPMVTVAPDVNGFYADWFVPGAQVTAFPFTGDPSALLRNLGFAQQCRDGGVQSFADGTFVGLMQTWTNCGGTATRNVQLAISPADRSATVHIEVQLPDADNTPLQAVLSSLQLR
jgi:hypothetical protein